MSAISLTSLKNVKTLKVTHFEEYIFFRLWVKGEKEILILLDPVGPQI
jgi:hypothetical protein